MFRYIKFQDFSEVCVVKEDFCFFCGDVLAEKGDAAMVAVSPDDVDTQPADVEDLESAASSWKSADEVLEQQCLDTPIFDQFALLPTL